MVYSVKRIVLESYPVLIVCIFISSAAGYVLNLNIAEIRELPIILVMIPPINGIGGNVGCILGARLTSALHSGILEPRLRGQWVLRGNIFASTLVSLGVFAFTGAIFFAIALAYGITLYRSLVLMLAFFAAGMVLTTVVMLATMISAFISFKRGLDPDNVVIPIVTSIGDVVGVTCLIMAIKIIGV